MDAITESLWAEAEAHLREFERLARRTVEEAWLAGDALLRIKEQLPHGAWTPALEERGISIHVAERMMRLRRKYPEILQIAGFDSVNAALTDSKKQRAAAPTKEKRTAPYLLSADDLWDWERGEVSTLARRLLSEEELQGFSANVSEEIRALVDSFNSDDLVSAGLYLMRRRMACYVNIGPLKEDLGAIEETKRRLSILGGHVDKLLEDVKTPLEDATVDHVAKV